VSEREEDGEATGGFGEEPVSASAANGSFDAVDGDFLCAAVVREDEVMRSKLLLDLVDACLIEETACAVVAGEVDATEMPQSSKSSTMEEFEFDVGASAIWKSQLLREEVEAAVAAAAGGGESENSAAVFVALVFFFSGRFLSVESFRDFDVDSFFVDNVTTGVRSSSEPSLSAPKSSKKSSLSNLQSSLHRPGAML
jgi:hypothetical protein